MKTTFSCRLIVLVLGLLSACQQPQVQVPRYRLKKVTDSYLNATPQASYSTYTYNASNQLIYTRSFGVDVNKLEYPVSRIDLTYDGAGKLIQSESRQDPAYPGHLVNFYYRYAYIYNEQNQLVESRWYKVILGKPHLAQQEQYGFGPDGLLTSISWKVYDPSDGSLLLGSEDTYQYENGNVVSIKNSSGNLALSYRYDDKFNPYYGLLVAQGFTALLLSKHNQLESDQEYTYNEQGYPIKKVSKDGSKETRFEYELY